MSRREDAKRLGRTLSHLRPEQAAHRARLRSQKLALSRRPALFEQRWTREVPDDAGWPAGFVPVDAMDVPQSVTVADLAAHRFTLVGESHCVDDPGGWRPTDRSQLFRYTLHYFEWAWALAADADGGTPANGRAVFADLWRSWRAGTTFGQWDEWSPYVVALRSWVLCGVFDQLVRGSDIEADVREQIGLHAGFVAANLELDVGGNHLIKNLKALIGLGVFLDDEKLIGRGRELLQHEIERQVLADGGHYERSPSYHCQVLGDLIDVGRLLKASNQPQVVGLEDAVTRMRRWLGVMRMPDGDVPLFGDATLVGLPRIDALGPIPRVHPEGSDTLTHLADSGYVVCRPSERLHVIIDVGPPCPPDLPAHAQAGCLAFVAAVDGERAIVDTGVSTYVGQRRAYERATKAHNTVEVGEVDQTEVWSSFRAGRLATPTVHGVRDDGDVLVVEASHDGYRHLHGAPTHRRRFEISTDRIVLRDSVDGEGFHRLFSRLFLAPGIEVELTEDGVGDDVTGAPFAHIGTTVAGAKVPAWIVFASVAQSFGAREACRSVWWEIWDDLPQQFVTEIHLGDPHQSIESGMP